MLTSKPSGLARHTSPLTIITLLICFQQVGRSAIPSNEYNAKQTGVWSWSTWRAPISLWRVPRCSRRSLWAPSPPPARPYIDQIRCRSPRPPCSWTPGVLELDANNATTGAKKSHLRFSNLCVTSHRRLWRHRVVFHGPRLFNVSYFKVLISPDNTLNVPLTTFLSCGSFGNRETLAHLQLVSLTFTVSIIYFKTVFFYFFLNLLAFFPLTSL